MELELAGRLLEVLRHMVVFGESLRWGDVEKLLRRWTNGEAAARFRTMLPGIAHALQKDIQGAYERDPAATGELEIMLAYPGFLAVTAYRLAHGLWELGVEMLPRLMSEYAHSKTGIDIHPGARIGDSFFIDHGTGVVVGETTVVGDHVTLYQGVTLGGLSTRGGQRLRGVKRHPTLEDHVTVYANATILGGETVIGRESVIGANVFLTESVPPNTTVRMKSPELEFLER